MNSFHTHPHSFHKIHFNIILPTTLTSSEWSVSCMFSNHKSVPIPCLPHACYVPFPYRPLHLLIVMMQMVTNFGASLYADFFSLVPSSLLVSVKFNAFLEMPFSVFFQLLQNLKMVGCWVTAPCNVVEVYWHFTRSCFLNHRDDNLSPPWEPELSL